MSIIAKGKGNLMSASDRAFTGKDGKLVQYKEALLLLSTGELLKVSVDQALYPVIAMLRNVEGDIELSVSARFDQSARLSLTGFLPKVGK